MGTHGQGPSQGASLTELHELYRKFSSSINITVPFYKRSYNSEWLSLVLGNTDSELKCQDPRSDSFVSKTCVFCTTVMFSFLSCDLLHTSLYGLKTPLLQYPRMYCHGMEIRKRGHLSIAQPVRRAQQPYKAGARGPSFLSLSLIRCRNFRVNALNKGPFQFPLFQDPFYDVNFLIDSLYNTKPLSTAVLLSYMLYAMAIALFCSSLVWSPPALYQVPTSAYLNLLTQNKSKVKPDFNNF